MRKIKLYYCPGHFSFPPHVILNEIGLPFEAIHMSIKDGATRTPDFIRLNPKGKIPVLDTGSEILTECSAILCYLAFSYPDRKLIPSSPMGIARTIEWTNWMSGIIASSHAQSLHPYRFTDEGHAHDGIRKKGSESLQLAYSQINDKLEGCEWAVADGYSIVDPTLLIFFKWGHLTNMDMSQFKNWETHTKRMEQRPAVQKTLASEGISVWK